MAGMQRRPEVTCGALRGKSLAKFYKFACFDGGRDGSCRALVPVPWLMDRPELNQNRLKAFCDFG
jgi:hypothetical protein